MAHRVLVVDDDTDTRVVLRAVLEDAGYAVEEAEDGPATLAALTASAVPMVVVLDLDLPRMDGLEVMGAAARDARLASRAAFVMLTALSYTRYEAAKQACEASGVPFLAKPFEIDALLAAVEGASHHLP